MRTAFNAVCFFEKKAVEYESEREYRRGFSKGKTVVNIYNILWDLSTEYGLNWFVLLAQNTNRLERSRLRQWTKPLLYKMIKYIIREED